MQNTIYQISIGLIKILPVFFFMGIAVGMPLIWYISLSIIIMLPILYILAGFSDKITKRNAFIATGIVALTLLFITISVREVLGLYFYYLQTITLKGELGEIKLISLYKKLFHHNRKYQKLRLFFLNPKKKILPIIVLMVLGVLFILLYHFLFGSIYDIMQLNNDSNLKHLFWMLVIFIVLVFYFLIAWPILEFFNEKNEKDSSFLTLFMLMSMFISIKMTTGEMNFIKEFFTVLK